MRKILVLVLAIALAAGCSSKPTPEQCAPQCRVAVAFLAAENAELRALNAKWQENYYKALRLIKLMQAKGKR